MSITLDVEDKEDMLNDVCDMIDEYDLANMRELRRFIREHGSDHNLPSMKIINSRFMLTKKRLSTSY